MTSPYNEEVRELWRNHNLLIDRMTELANTKGFTLNLISHRSGWELHSEDTGVVDLPDLAKVEEYLKGWGQK